MKKTKDTNTAISSGIRIEISRMGSEVSQFLQYTIDSILRTETRKKGFVNQRYNKIYEMQNDIESAVISLLSKNTQDESNLHDLITAVRISVHLERIAARCKHIALSEITLPLKELKNDLLKIQDILKTCMKIFILVLESYENENIDRISNISSKNLSVYSRYSRFNIRICSQIQKNPEKAEEYIKLININRDIERLATHVLNISETIYYQVTGQKISLQNRTSIEDE